MIADHNGSLTVCQAIHEKSCGCRCNEPEANNRTMLKLENRM
jgi:hypothetical protein